MPEANRLFNKKGSVASEIQGWEEVKTQLDAAYTQYSEQCAINERLAPDILLRSIDAKLNSLIEVWNNLVDVQRNAVEEALKSKVLEEAVKEVVSQKEAQLQKEGHTVTVKDIEENSTVPEVTDISTGPIIRETTSIAFAPPPMVGTANMAPGTEVSCVVPQPQQEQDPAAGGENASRQDLEREPSPNSKD
jgi:hypothetical protein